MLRTLAKQKQELTADCFDPASRANMPGPVFGQAGTGRKIPGVNRPRAEPGMRVLDSSSPTANHPFAVSTEESKGNAVNGRTFLPPRVRWLWGGGLAL